MRIKKRQPGDRRWTYPPEFPLTDCEGVMVMNDRRMNPDRRKTNLSLEEVLVLLSEMPISDSQF